MSTDYGESRKLWAMYQTPRHDMLVGRAIAMEFLSEMEVGANLLPFLTQQIAFYREDLNEKN